MKKIIIKAAAFFSAIFGLLTLFMGGSVIFDLFGMRARHGNYISFVVWANFVCAFLYIASAYGFYSMKKWTATILNIAILILVLAFIGLLVWIFNGYLYEKSTIGAMIFRMAATIILAFVARLTMKKSSIDHVL